MSGSSPPMTSTNSAATGTQLRCAPSHRQPPTRIPVPTTTATTTAPGSSTASTPSAIVAPRMIPATPCSDSRAELAIVGYIAITAPSGA